MGLNTDYNTLSKCKQEALKYSTRTDFFNAHTCYYIAHSRGWLEEICQHMEVKRVNWTVELCRTEASKYNKKTDFRKNSKKAYEYALREGLIDIMCLHMEGHSSTRKYTFEICRDEALEYETLKEYRTKSPNNYDCARKNGWLSEISRHFKKKLIYTKDECRVEALKYETREEFRKNSKNIYECAYINDFLSEICGHMIKSDKKIVNRWK